MIGHRLVIALQLVNISATLMAITYSLTKQELL